MSFLFKLILVLIFIYLIYRIASMSKASGNPYKGENDRNADVRDDQKDSIQKKIDMSDVEDADYKEIK